jgi:hypothetical protein
MEPQFPGPILLIVRTSISVNLKHKNNDLSFTVVNIYGPYSDRASFWEDLVSVDVFRDPLLVVGGDLNFTLSLRKFGVFTLGMTSKVNFSPLFYKRPDWWILNL